jgi:hypothetical protein
MKKNQGLLGIVLAGALAVAACDDSSPPSDDGGTRTYARAVRRASTSCNGVVCVAGFSCKQVSNFGVVTRSCVSDTGEPPKCSCAEGETCDVEPSGATTCTAPAAAAVAPAFEPTCDGFACPPGTSCRIATLNFGVPAPTCLYD